jgi:two-component system response regulator HupR/HoxA
MEEHDVHAALLGPGANGASALGLLADLRARWPETQRLLTAPTGDEAGLAAAVGAGQLHHFLPDPASGAQIRLAVAEACRAFRLARDNARLAAEARMRPARAAAPEPLAASAFGPDLRGASPAMAALAEEAARIASFDVPVLIRGEPATGKAALARAIHLSSLRSDRPFQALDVAGLPDTALALELFGARHGALPGLAATRAGLAQRAHRGTLFLDRVETLSPEMQLALLRLLEDGTARPLGSAEAQPAQLRLIAGTEADLAAEAAAGRFRADLHFALSVTELALPPLRARPEDIPALAAARLADAARRHAKPVRGFTAEALAALARHRWPGNLRELENEVTRMLIAAPGAMLGPELISRLILQRVAPSAGDHAGGGDVAAVMARPGPLRKRVEEIEARILHETLTRLCWNKSRAAAELGLSRVGLRAKLDRYGLAPPDPPHGDPPHGDAPPETAPPGTAPPDTAPPDTAPPATAPPDTAPPATAPPSVASPESASRNAAPPGPRRPDTRRAPHTQDSEDPRPCA